MKTDPSELSKIENFWRVFSSLSFLCMYAILLFMHKTDSLFVSGILKSEEKSRK